jgi:hypothetical protein
MFRYVTSTLAACALAATVAVAGQERTPPSDPQQEQNKPAPTPATVTGCVQEAKTTDGGTVHVLNKAQGGSSQLYVLTGPPPSELASHVNHRVEVTGQVQEPSTPNEPPPDSKVLRPPVMVVESVKMVAETCE